MHGELTPETLDRAAVQLTGARLADAHLRPSLAQRELIAVIPRDDLTLASRKPPQRVLNSCVEIFLLVPLGEAVVDGRALMRTLVHEDVERHRELGRLGSTVGATSLVNTTKLVDHRTADPQRRVGLERHAAARIKTVDGRDKADHRRGRSVIPIRERGRRDAHAAGNADGQIRVALDQRSARLCAARATLRPQLGYVHARTPSAAAAPHPTALHRAGPPKRASRETVT